MPVVHETFDCPACKRRPVSYFAAGDTPDPQTSYKLDCPQTSFTVRDIGSAGVWKQVAAKPAAAVEIPEME